MLHLFKHSFPEDMESGLEDDKVFDHPYTTMPSADRKDLGVFYPFMGHACHLPVVEVDIETGRCRSWPTPPCTTAARWSTPARSPGTSSAAPRRASARRCTRSSSTTTTASCSPVSYLDYLIPSAMEVPEIKIGHHETPSPVDPARDQGRW